VIYLDSSVALAFLFAEPHQPPADLWGENLFASRLLAYEIWNRVHARKAEERVGRRAEALLERVLLLELSPVILGRALESFPAPVRTLHALHLATMAYVREDGWSIELASYDARLLAGARMLGIPCRAL
jgi:predicted nucleic acid-binding protein